MDRHKESARRRLRRRRHIRKRIFGNEERPRLSISRSHKNFYCQVIDDESGVTICSASTLSPELKDARDTAGNREGATKVGTLIAQKLKEKGIQRVAFDRNGYRYHGRVAAMCDAVRKEGIQV